MCKTLVLADENFKIIMVYLKIRDKETKLIRQWRILNIELKYILK